MSQIKVNEIYDASGGSTAKLYGPSMRYGGTAFVNRITNGNMSVWQRGTSFASPGNITYTADRWFIGLAGSNLSSAARVAGPAGFQYALQITGAAGNVTTQVNQRIESINAYDLVGQPATIQAVLQSSSAMTVGWTLFYANATDSFGSLTVISSGTWSATTSATLFTATTAVLPAGAANGLMLLISPNNGGGFTSGTLTITGVQLEAGTIATPFERRDYGRELMMCQRYARFNTTETGASWATTVITFSVGYDIEMRSAPTVTIVNGANAMTDLGVATRTATGIPYFAATTRGAQVDISTVSTTNNKVHVLAPSVLFLNSEL